MLEASCLLSKPHTVLHRLSAMQVGGRQTPTATPCGCLKQCPSRAHLAPGPAPAQRARAARRSALRRAAVSGDAALATDEPKLQRPDINGRFGKYGGKCVAPPSCLVSVLPPGASIGRVCLPVANWLTNHRLSALDLGAQVCAGDAHRSAHRAGGRLQGDCRGPELQGAPPARPAPLFGAPAAAAASPRRLRRAGPSTGRLAAACRRSSRRS